MYLSDYSNTQILEHFGFPLNEINQNKIEQWLTTGHLFGFACLGDHQMAELGYCSFRELFEFYMHHPFLHIERDIAYEAVSLATIIHKCKNIPYFVGLFGLCIDSKYYDQLKDRYWFTTIGNKIFPHKK